MESPVMALRGLFLRRKPARMNREQTSGAPGGSPPLGPYLGRGSQSGPRLRAPPPGARLRWPGTPAPGQHQPHLIFGGQAWPPLARPPRCFLGGRCGGLLAVVGQAPASYIVGGGARGGPPAGVGSDAIGSTRCAHWSSQHGEKAFSPRCPGRHYSACPVSVFCFTDSPAKKSPNRSLPAPGCRFSPAALPPPRSRPPRFL